MFGLPQYGPARAFFSKLFIKFPYQGRRTYKRGRGRKKPYGPAAKDNRVSFYILKQFCLKIVQMTKDLLSKLGWAGWKKISIWLSVMKDGHRCARSEAIWPRAKCVNWDALILIRPSRSVNIRTHFIKPVCKNMFSRCEIFTLILTLVQK